MSTEEEQLLAACAHELNHPDARWFLRNGQLFSSLAQFHVNKLRAHYLRGALAILALPARVACRDVRRLIARAMMRAAAERVWRPPVPRVEYNRTMRDLAAEGVAHLESWQAGFVVFLIPNGMSGMLLFSEIPLAWQDHMIVVHGPWTVRDAVERVTMFVIVCGEEHAKTPGIMRFLREASPRLRHFLVTVNNWQAQIKFQ